MFQFQLEKIRLREMFAVRSHYNNAEEYKIYQAFCAKYNFTEDVQPLAQHR
jgi:hypothetical protein